MTNRSIERAAANATLRDDRVPGLIVLVRPKSKTFYLYKRVHGQPRRVKLGRFPFMTVEQARKKAVSVGHEVETGTFGVPCRFAELWTLYCETKRNKRTLEGDQQMYDKRLEQWADHAPLSVCAKIIHLQTRSTS